MKLVIFGLSVSSSWGNGHATIWRGLIRALSIAGHQVIFFERNEPYYANHRDLTQPEGGELFLYSSWKDVKDLARAQLREADAGMVTSYCPDGIAATDLVLNSPARHLFYDLDTPVTLSAIREGRDLTYLGPGGLREFDLIFSYTGGESLRGLKAELGARQVVPIYGCVDPTAHYPVPSETELASDLSYIGTYAQDRMEALNELFLRPASMLRDRRFRIAGSLYPADFPWQENIHYNHHISPGRHPAFYCSSRVTLNVTRGPMVASGYCPSGRLFEAAACGAPIISDWWMGLDSFFDPGKEILVARNSEEVIGALERSDEELTQIGKAGRERVLAQHTAAHRVSEMIQAIEEIGSKTQTAAQ